MRWNALVPLLCSLLTASEGCKKHETPPPAPRDVCSLITLAEIQTIQGSPIRETKNSARSNAGFRVSQCFYTATEFSESVNLALIQPDPDDPARRSPKDFWKEKFGPYNTNENEHDGKAKTEAGEEKGPPPKKISGLGDDAYWVGNRFGGILYVLKGDAFISISLGGTTDEATKRERSRTLAQRALQRL
jgi:hypothetical protein